MNVSFFANSTLLENTREEWGREDIGTSSHLLPGKYIKQHLIKKTYDFLKGLCSLGKCESVKFPQMFL